MAQEGTPRPGRFTGYIPGKLYEELDQSGHPFVKEEQPDDVKLVSEIAARILDLRDLGIKKPIRLINQFIRLYRVSPNCLWLACEILASHRQGGKSLSDLAEESYFTKQAIHQSQVRDLQELERIMPGIADEMRRILGRNARISTTQPPKEGPNEAKSV